MLNQHTATKTVVSSCQKDIGISSQDTDAA